ncbi:MAG: histidine kinase [Bacteroidota bacterium]
MPKLASQKIIIVIIGIVVFWVIVAIISSSQLYIRFADRYEGGWWNMFNRQLPVWLSWAILTPVVFYLTVLFIRKNENKTSLLLSFHFLLALVVAFVCAVLQSTLAPLFYESESTFSATLSNNLLASTATNLLIYLMIAAVAHLFIYYSNYQKAALEKATLNLKNEKLENQLTEARLKTLKKQIEPHFLFNTLHSISSLVRTKRNESAIEMIAQLSDLLRHSIDDNKSTMASLENEMAFLKKYLQIEQVRFEDRLAIELTTKGDIGHVMVPSLLLQPLVENALKHGLKEQAKGLLEIHLAETDGHILIEIKDNGTGFNGSSSTVAGSGLGISNTLERLEETYGKSYNIQFIDAPKGGALVRLKLPVNRPIP